MGSEGWLSSNLVPLSPQADYITSVLCLSFLFSKAVIIVCLRGRVVTYPSLPEASLIYANFSALIVFHLIFRYPSLGIKLQKCPRYVVAGIELVQIKHLEFCPTTACIYWTLAGISYLNAMPTHHLIFF